jgi:long-subunit fatty acid transport protein
MIRRFFATLLIVTITTTIALSQSVTNSPYTRFGIGEIDRNGFNDSKAMGGISTGLRVRNKINYMNPAAISAQDTMSFIFDIGLNGSIKHLKTNTSSADFNNVLFDHIAMSFPIKRWWFMALGLTPYSKIGYDVKSYTPHSVIDTINMSYINSGNGGINQVFFSNSFKLNKNLSLGLNINYLFGSIEQYRQINIQDDFNGNATIIENDFYLKKFSYDLGFQYHNIINKKYFYTIGLTYSNKISFNGDKKTVILSTPVYNTDAISIKNYINSYTTTVDTIASETTKNNLTVPSNYGIGFTVGIIDKLTFGMDYTYQDWGNVSEFDVNNISLSDYSVSYSNDQTIKLGIDYIPDLESYRNYLLKINYRLGFYYNKGYLQIGDNQINNYGITFGVGLPITSYRTNLSFSCTIGKKGTMENGLIEENFTSFGVNFTLYDFWFFKRKYQ